MATSYRQRKRTYSCASALLFCVCVLLFLHYVILGSGAVGRREEGAHAGFPLQPYRVLSLLVDGPERVHCVCLYVRVCRGDCCILFLCSVVQPPQLHCPASWWSCVAVREAETEAEVEGVRRVLVCVRPGRLKRAARLRIPPHFPSPRPHCPAFDLSRVCLLISVAGVTWEVEAQKQCQPSLSIWYRRKKKCKASPAAHR